MYGAVEVNTNLTFHFRRIIIVRSTLYKETTLFQRSLNRTRMELLPLTHVVCVYTVHTPQHSSGSLENPCQSPRRTHSKRAHRSPQNVIFLISASYYCPVLIHLQLRACSIQRSLKGEITWSAYAEAII